MKLYIDGGCRPNPGEMVIAVVSGEGEAIMLRSVGYGTNNRAEYIAAMKAVEYAVEHDANELKMLTDSNLVYNQLLGRWKINDEFFEDCIKIIRDNVKKFSNFEIKKIGRDENLAGKIIEDMWKHAKDER